MAAENPAAGAGSGAGATAGDRPMEEAVKLTESVSKVPKVTVLPDGSKLYRYNCILMKLIKGYGQLPMERRAEVKRAVKLYLDNTLGRKAAQECVLRSDDKNVTYGIPEAILPRFKLWITQQMKSAYEPSMYPYIEVMDYRTELGF
ncbi:hypothetical protein HK101_006314 [Irineochytrium annulatum]|nr:hypothetical protein HK101_006314 [Irineochytrium annulatum]